MQRREAFEKQPPEEVEKYTILHDIGDIVGLSDGSTGT